MVVIDLRGCHVLFMYKVIQNVELRQKMQKFTDQMPKAITF